MTDGTGEAALRFDLTSRTFHPKSYIRHMYSNATHDDFEKTLLQSVGHEANVTVEALKDLIRDNIGTFISSREAMDAMYASDRSLFTGEAVDPIADAFHSILADGKALVAPTAELFGVLRASRMTRETLTKLMIVWRVPGVIYEYCGARVAQLKSELSQLKRWGKMAVVQKGGGGNSNNKNNQSSSKDEEESSIADDDNDDDDDDGGDPNDGDATQRITRGALEELADGTGMDSDYVLHPGEELVHWYGTPLARLRHRRAATKATKTGSNYEGAVLTLRRAMLYMEENYDMERAAVLGVGAGEDEAAGEEQPRQHDGIALMYQYALALFRAALYLNDQMAWELQQASAADTVFIEDILSAMMDTAIATVKLRHFCLTARNNLQLGADQDAILSDFQHELRSNNAGAGEEGEEADGENSLRGTTPSLASVPATTANSSCTMVSTALLSPSLSSLQAEVHLHRLQQQQQQEEEETGRAEALPPPPPPPHQQRQQKHMVHPVEYYVRITCNQHFRMMEDAALRLSQEASEWQRKFMSGDHHVERRGSMSKSDSTGKMPFSSAAAAAAVFLGVGTPGVANDSFTAFNSVGLLPLELTADATVSERIKVGRFGVDLGESDELQHAEAILEALRTSESDFARFTTFSLGEVDMNEMLECSTAQLQMHAASLLQQLVDRLGFDVVGRAEATPVAAAAAAAATMGVGAGAGTFVHRLFVACVDRLEVVLVSYWGGIAAAVHGGVFDFTPDPSSALHRMLSGQAVLGARDSVAAKSDGKRAVDELPRLRFIPVVQDGGQTLRQLSIEVMRKMVKAASDILYALLLTSVNRTVLRGFVRTMAAYRVVDVTPENDDDEKDDRGSNKNTSSGTWGLNDERIELHAAILVEVILEQWEKAMTHVANSVRRMKVVIGESCTSTSLLSEGQAQEVGELLEELEQLRSILFRCYTHGVGMLAKAYLMLLPSLQQTVMPSSSSSSSSGSLCARLSRDFVSSVLVNKLLNLLSVVVDRTACFLNRFDEVYDGVDLFAAKAERSRRGGEQQRQQNGRSSRIVRRKPAKRNDVAATMLAQEEEEEQQQQQQQQLDAVTAFMARCNSKVVLDHIADHERLLLALVSNLLLVFIDVLHQKCQRISFDAAAAPEMREHIIIESLADALCLPTAAMPIVVSELVTPCVLKPVVQLTPDAKSPHECRALLGLKEERFRTNYLSAVEEHCQLVVDAMLGMFLAAPQQRITQEVRAAGFMMPMMDWQRVSGLTAAAVRPYIADCIVHIARAHERLQWLRQPLLGVVVTQRLVAHIALAFVTALTSDGNAFEISFDCSSSFLSYGLLLIEAEARVILGMVDALVDVVSKNPKSGAVLPELTVAREVLQGTVASLQRQGAAVCEALSAASARGNGRGSGSDGDRDGDVEVLNLRQREARCEAMVQSAIQRSHFIVQAIITHLEDSTITAAFKPLSGSVTETVLERLAKRKEGCHSPQTVQKHAEKRVKLHRPRPRPEAPATATPAATLGEEGVSETAVTPRTVARLSVLQCAAEQEERRVGRAVGTMASIDKIATMETNEPTDTKVGNEAGSSHSGAERLRQLSRRNRNTAATATNTTTTATAAAAGGVGGGVARGSKANTHRFKRTLAL